MCLYRWRYVDDNDDVDDIIINKYNSIGNSDITNKSFIIPIKDNLYDTKIKFKVQNCMNDIQIVNRLFLTYISDAQWCSSVYTVFVYYNRIYHDFSPEHSVAAVDVVKFEFEENDDDPCRNTR